MKQVYFFIHDFIWVQFISFSISLGICFTLALTIQISNGSPFLDLAVGIISATVFLAYSYKFSTEKHRLSSLIFTYLIGIFFTFYFIGPSFWPENSQWAYQKTYFPLILILVYATSIVFWLLKTHPSTTTSQPKC
jgi:hypothetical protein